MSPCHGEDPGSIPGGGVMMTSDETLDEPIGRPFKGSYNDEPLPSTKEERIERIKKIFLPPDRDW